MLPMPAIAGIGLRDAHCAEIDDRRPAIGWLEAHSENFFGDERPRQRRLERLRAHYPLSFHGVGLSLGSAEALDTHHLRQLAMLVRRHEPQLVSEHCCWGGFSGLHSNQLLPLPRTREALDLLCAHIDQLQEALGRRVAIENVASYLDFRHADMNEPDFLGEVVRRSGCALLLDISNLHLNSLNHGFDAQAWLAAVPAAAVVEYHLAGYDDRGSVCIDTHDRPVAAAVWSLYADALRLIGPRPTLIERDVDLPPLAQLLDEMLHADRLLQSHVAAVA